MSNGSLIFALGVTAMLCTTFVGMENLHGVSDEEMDTGRNIYADVLGRRNDLRRRVLGGATGARIAQENGRG